MPYPYTRKTIDCWRFYVNYGAGWEHEITEYTLANMKVNKRAYEQNCKYPLKIKRGRDPISDIPQSEWERIDGKKRGSKKR